MSRINKEDIEGIFTRLFQGLINKGFKDKFGEGWFENELMPRIIEKARKDDDETAKKYSDFISNKGTKASLSDMDVTLCSTILIYDEKYRENIYSESSQKSMLHELRGDRNRLFGHSGMLSEAMRMTLFSRVIADLQLSLDTFDISSFDEVLAKDIRRLQESFFGMKLSETSSGPLAAQYDEGEKLFSQGKIDAAFNVHNELAEMGYAPSMARLAELYIKGTGTTQSFEKAEKWLAEAEKLGSTEAVELLEKIKEFRKLEKEAELGSSISQVKLGTWYESGELVGRDAARALECYSKALSRGSLFAKNRILSMGEEGNLQALECIYHQIKDSLSFDEKKKLVKEVFNKSENPDEWERITGLMSEDSKLMSDLCAEFYKDRSSGKNTDKCLLLAQKGTELKYSSNMNMLGILYNYGIGVAKDEKKAADLYEEAAGLGNTAGSANIAYMYMYGIGRMVDYGKAFKHVKFAAENGIPRGQFLLGGFYMNELKVGPAYNTIVEKNPEKAFECYLAAANQGYMPAYMPLADCYWFGKGIKYDKKAALEWYEKADCEEGYRRIADIYGNKFNDNYYDPRKAFECLRKAAALGNDPEYDYELGKCYYEGTGTKRDAALAAKHLLNCYTKHKERSKKEECAYMLGVLYKNGEGVEQNDAESFKFFVEAASSTYNHNYKALYEVSKYVRRDPEMFNCMTYDFKSGRHYFNSCGVRHGDVESMLWLCRKEGLLEARWEYYAGGYSQSRSDLMAMADENYLPAMEEVLGLYDDGEIELSDRKLFDLYLKVKKQGGRIYLSKNISARLELLLK